MSRQISISEFYSGKCVFITGGTGFIGKTIVEKLLRSCPKIDTIYLLARPKKDKTALERVQELTESPLFDVVRSKNPEIFKKISLIKGDIAEKNLGLSEADQKLFCNKINVIIHSAATISFDEPLKVAVAINLQSIKELMNLARRTKQLDAFVHVSTTYTNWFEGDVKEIIYQPKYEPNKVIEMCQTLTDEELMKQVKLGKHKNTYTFTKNLTECLISQEGHDLPMTIVRPTIVTTSVNEPFPGWVGNWNIPILTFYMTAKGVFRHPYMCKNLIIDVIPCDITVNMILAAGWKVGTSQNAKNSNVEIYNCSTSSLNPISFHEFYSAFAEQGKIYPSSQIFGYPKIKFYDSFLLSKVATFTYQKIPAYLGDFILRLAGKKPKLVKLIDFVYKNYNKGNWVATNEIIFHSENSIKLMNSMSQKDLQEFDFDVRKINWQKFIPKSYLGIRKHLGKEKSEDWPILRKKVQRFKYAQYLTTASLIAGSLFLLSKSQNLISRKKGNNTE